MNLFALGVNHKTAPITVREKVAFAPEKLPDALRELTQQTGFDEAAILSTCNRTELYLCGKGLPEQAVIGWLSHYHRITDRELRPYLYIHPGQQAVRHILRVASGLDSLVLGEPQILGQLKEAYLCAADSGTAGRHLNRLFQHTFSVAKQVRTDTAIGANPVSVAFAAVSLARQIFTRLEGHTALLIGAGETIALVARHLKKTGIGHLILANRTVARAEALAREVGAQTLSLGELHDHLAEADIVITSTASPLPLLGKGAVERALKARRHRPMFMVDIAVPRDIEPEVGDLNDVYLYTVDDLLGVIEENRRTREAAAHEADEIIDTQVARFMGWLNSLEAVDTICSYRHHAERLRNEALAQAHHQLALGKDANEVLDQLARLLTNKLMHAPSVQMHRAAFEGNETLLNAARQIFDIKDDTES